MKKTIVLMLALIMVLCFSVPCFALTFSDVSSEAWYAPFVFDLTDKKSFTHVEEWLKHIEKYAKENVLKFGEIKV